MHVWPLYGLLTALAVYLVWKKEQRPADSLGAALVLALLWCLTNISHWWIPHPYNQWLPITDYLAFVICGLAWRKTFRPWKVAFLALFGAEIASHVQFTALGDFSRRAKYIYDLKLNLLYVGQLASVVFARGK